MKRKKSAHYKVLIFVGLFFFLLLGFSIFYFFKVTYPVFLDQNKATTLKNKITELRSSAMQISDKQFDNQVNFLISNGIITQKLASSKVDVCYIYSEDRGFVPIDYYQDCYLRYTAGFRTVMEKATIQNILKQNKTTAQLFGEPNAYPPSDCDLYESGYGIGFSNAPLLYLAAGKYLHETGLCAIPDPIQGIGRTNQVFTDDMLTTKIFHTFNRDNISIDYNEVWIERDDDYYHESLGCSGLVFCNSPRQQPVTGN